MITCVVSHDILDKERIAEIIYEKMSMPEVRLYYRCNLRIWAGFFGHLALSLPAQRKGRIKVTVRGSNGGGN